MAGTLSTRSPCDLPLIPMTVGAAISEYRSGPIVIAAGFATTFTTLGILIGLAGHSLGISQDTCRWLGAWLMVMFGSLMFSSMLQEKLSTILSGLSQIGNGLLERFSSNRQAG